MANEGKNLLLDASTAVPGAFIAGCGSGHFRGRDSPRMDRMQLQHTSRFVITVAANVASSAMEDANAMGTVTASDAAVDEDVGARKQCGYGKHAGHCAA